MDDIRLIGIELGTSGIRVAVYDMNGTILDANEVEIKEQTVNEWLNALIKIFPTEMLKEISSDKKIDY